MGKKGNGYHGEVGTEETVPGRRAMPVHNATLQNEGLHNGPSPAAKSTTQ